MRRTPLSRTLLLAVLAALAGFQLVGLTVGLVTASRPRHTDLGLYGPGLGGPSELVRLRGLGGLPVDSVAGPALEAGLRAGDVVTHIDGVATARHPRVWYDGRFTVAPGTTLRLTVRRDGGTIATDLRTRRLAEPLRYRFGGSGPDAPTMDYRAFHWWTWGPVLFMSLLLFAVGLTIGILRGAERSAWTFALVFLGISIATSISGGTPLLHVWPPWLAMFWSVSTIAGTSYSMPLTVRGLMEFPTATRLSRRLWPWRWAPFVLLGVTGAAEIVLMVARYSGAWEPGALAGPGRLADTAFNVSLAIGFAAMAALLFAHRFEPAGANSSRLLVLWYGAMGAVAGGLWAVLIPDAVWLRLARPFGTPGAWVGMFLADVAPSLLVSLLPLSFAYTILARRLFGIRFVIRRGLQHLLLSRGVLVVDGIVLYLILEFSIRRGVAVPGIPGPALSGVVALVVVSLLALVNRPLMQALDRRFFRDRYDARRVLLALGQEISRLRERDELLERIGAAILAALHPARAVVYLRGGEGDRLRAAWSSRDGSGRAPDPAEAEGAMLAARLAAEGDRPWIALDPPVRGRAPGAMWDDDAGGAGDGTAPAATPIELCVPLRQSGRVTGCIALAVKRSEEPYTSEDRELLATVASQAALALENAELLDVARREAQFAREVEIARDVQRNLFPRELPAVPGLEVAALCRPARTVAGDYYDVLRGADGGLCVALGDVSGKGVGASLLSAGVHAMVRSRLPAAACDLGRLLEDLNAHLVESSADGMFATVVVAGIEPGTGRVRYANAGHPPPLLLTDGGARRLDDGGPLAGVIPGARYVPGETTLAPGDLLAIYSDGVTEAEGPGRGLFGEERLLAALMDARGVPAGEALEAVLRAVEAFSGGGEPADDLSLIVVRRLP